MRSSSIAPTLRHHVSLSQAPETGEWIHHLRRSCQPEIRLRCGYREAFKQSSQFVGGFNALVLPHKVVQQHQKATADVFHCGARCGLGVRPGRSDFLWHGSRHRRRAGEERVGGRGGQAGFGYGRGARGASRRRDEFRFVGEGDACSTGFCRQEGTVLVKSCLDLCRITAARSEESNGVFEGLKHLSVVKRGLLGNHGKEGTAVGLGGQFWAGVVLISMMGTSQQSTVHWKLATSHPRGET
eukprot:870611-Rhodomonas_salina.3